MLKTNSFQFFKPILSIDKTLSDLKTKPSLYWEKRGERMALDLFKFAQDKVPAYQKFLSEKNILASDIKNINDFKKLPPVDKHSYVNAFPYEELLLNQDISKITTFSSTSGSTGEPTYFPRGEEQDWQYEHIVELFLKNQFEIDNKKTLGVIGFGLGIWIGGIFTYKNFNNIARKGYPLALAPVGTNKDIFLKTIKKVGSSFDQIILMGYPPFIKDVIDEAEEYGIDWSDYSIKVMTATESFSEQFREYIARKAKIKNPLTDILNIYGSVELGTMAHETPMANFIRGMAVKNKKIFKEIFPEAILLPTLAQYHPHLTYFEEENGELFASGFASSFPLIRYRFFDKGTVIPFDTMVSKLNSVGIDIIKEAEKANIEKTILKLPFVCVYERSDFVVVLRGANIYPENIKTALQDKGLEKFVTGKFTMIKKEDKKLNDFLEINVELKRNVESNGDLKKRIEKIVINTLRKINSEFNYLYTLEGNKLTPNMILYPHGHPKYFGVSIKQKWVKK